MLAGAADYSGAIGLQNRLCHGAGRIVLVKFLEQAGEDGFGQGRVAAGFADFVARRIQHNRRMIAVAAHGVARVRLVPVAEKQVIIVRVFPRLPAVEHLIHHDDAHLVARRQALRRRRIVGGPDRVAAHRLDRLQAVDPFILRHGNPERADIGMQTFPLQLEIFSVKPEAGLGFELKVQNAKCGRVVINGLARGYDLRALAV